ncbi:MAG TPA: DNA polymerase III subunit alpha [Elusimicrobiales bacterium]|nr:DNA polymerase III subunit alpha [Elusimicrobiales bacterium]
MAKAAFIHLHNHSEYSLFDGMLRFTDCHGRPSEFMRWLAEQKNPAMAVTDHGNMYGAAEFYFTARELGIKPIIGCEVYVQRTPVTDKSEGSHKGANHLVLLAKNADGYANLCRIVSRSYLEGFNHGPKVDLEMLEKHARGLICLSGCIAGPVARACRGGDPAGAVGAARRLADIFGKGDFYIELMDNGMKEQAEAMKGLLEVAKKTKLPVVATNDCHYWKAADWETHDVKLCLNTRSLVGATDRFRFSGREYYFKSPEQMAKLFSHTPEALRNTLAIAARCDVKLPEGEPLTPPFKSPAKLKELCLKGLGKPTAEQKKRLDAELKAVKAAGLEDYFLILADAARRARAEGVLTGPGRGTAAGSLINFALGLTAVDPLKYGLSFDRFLDTSRSPFPPLTVEVQETRRGKFLELLAKKHGADAVAAAGYFSVKQPRNLARDLGIALGIDRAAVERLVAAIPFNHRGEVSDLVEVKHLLADPAVEKLADFTDRLCGIKNGSGADNAAVVIAPGPAAGFMPLSNAGRRGEPAAQYGKRDLARLGFMQFDLAGQRALDAQQAALERIKTRGFGLDAIAEDDLKTWTLIAHGVTTGVHGLETEGIKKYLVQLQPSRLEDLAALIALYRPGPMQAGLLDAFIAAKAKKGAAAPHAALEPLLKDTWGALVYQEQLMAAAERIGGFGPPRAAELRRALAAGGGEAQEKLRKEFIAGARKKKFGPREAAAVFDALSRAASHAVCKAHAVPQALLAYRQAWLKANYPREFMTALIENERGRQDQGNYALYMAEARRIGVKI